MESFLVSIIIPVFNVEKYLRECIDSVISQTYTNLEIWLVDDGSEDSSGNICEQYASRDSRIKVIHKENGGLSSARNKALDQMTGKYVYFLDSDDFISKDLIMAYVEKIEKYDVDVVMGTSFEFYRNINPKILHSNPSCKDEVFSKIEALKMMFLDDKLYHAAAGPLFKAELYSDIRFPEGMLYEDYATTFYVISKTEKVLYCDDKRCFYRTRPDSIMNSKVTNKDMVLLDIAEKVSNDMIEQYPELEIQAIRKIVVVNLKLYSRILNVSFNSFKKEQERIRKTINVNASVFFASDCIRKIDKIKLKAFLMGRIPFYIGYKLNDFIQMIRKSLA